MPKGATSENKAPSSPSDRRETRYRIDEDKAAAEVLARLRASEPCAVCGWYHRGGFDGFQFFHHPTRAGVTFTLNETQQRFVRVIHEAMGVWGEGRCERKKLSAMADRNCDVYEAFRRSEEGRTAWRYLFTGADARCGRGFISINRPE